MFQRGRFGLNQGKEEGRLRLALFSSLEITMPKGPFLPSDFTATKFSTAADKAEFGNTLLRFIESEWASALFTKRFYNRLSMCFSHIAHYVEGVIMRSACVNTLWIKSSTTSSLCIIRIIDLSAASQLPGGRSPYRNVKVCILDARFAPWRTIRKSKPPRQQAKTPSEGVPAALSRGDVIGSQTAMKIHLIAARRTHGLEARICAQFRHHIL
jgi:hypothetical protein